MQTFTLIKQIINKTKINVYNQVLNVGFRNTFKGNKTINKWCCKCAYKINGIKQIGVIQENNKYRKII